ncbi:MAG: FG-GAP repeat protein, partial [Dyadobacter sp.]
MENSLPSFKRILAVFIVLLCSIQSVYAQNWNQILKSVAGDRQDKTNAGRSYADNFGYSVAISGTYAIVGTPNEDEDDVGANFMENSGAAYLFY